MRLLFLPTFLALLAAVSAPDANAGCGGGGYGYGSYSGFGYGQSLRRYSGWAYRGNRAYHWQRALQRRYFRGYGRAQLSGWGGGPGNFVYNAGGCRVGHFGYGGYGFGGYGFGYWPRVAFTSYAPAWTGVSTILTLDDDIFTGNALATDADGLPQPREKPVGNRFLVDLQ